jgi:hypothetical protein
VDFVELSFIVEDGRGRYIRDLKPPDIRISEDGISQRISTFAQGSKLLMRVLGDGGLSPVLLRAADDRSEPARGCRRAR